MEYLLSSTEGPGPGLASLMLDDDSRLSASCSLSNQDNRILGQKDDRIIRDTASADYPSFYDQNAHAVKV